MDKLHFVYCAAEYDMWTSVTSGRSRAVQYSSHVAAKFLPSSSERLLLALVRGRNPRLWYRWYLFPSSGAHRPVVNSSWHSALPLLQKCAWPKGNDVLGAIKLLAQINFFSGISFLDFISPRFSSCVMRRGPKFILRMTVSFRTKILVALLYSSHSKLFSSDKH